MIKTNENQLNTREEETEKKNNNNINNNKEEEIRVVANIFIGR